MKSASLLLAQATPAGRAMGEQLLATGEVRFKRASAVGARPMTSDWRLAPELMTGPLAAAAAEVGLQLAAPGSTPAMACQTPTPTDAGTPVPKMNVSALEVKSAPPILHNLCSGSREDP